MKRYFYEVTESIQTTTIIPFMKLDYVFASYELKDLIKVRILERPICGTDHDPIEILIGEYF